MFHWSSKFSRKLFNTNSMAGCFLGSIMTAVYFEGGNDDDDSETMKSNDSLVTLLHCVCKVVVKEIAIVASNIMIKNARFIYNNMILFSYYFDIFSPLKI